MIHCNDPGYFTAHTADLKVGPAFGHEGARRRRMSHRLSEAALWMSFRGPMMTARKKVLGLSGEPNAANGQPVRLQPPCGATANRHRPATIGNGLLGAPDTRRLGAAP